MTCEEKARWPLANVSPQPGEKSVKGAAQMGRNSVSGHLFLRSGSDASGEFIH
jgi:hypothetical protein